MSLESLSPILFETVSAVTTDPSVELGSRRTDEAGNDYVYCYNAGEYQILPGRCGYLGSLNTGYSMTATNAAAQVGVYCGGIHHTTLTTGAYGWVMTKGLCRVSPDSSAVTFDAGEYIAVGVNDGYVSAPVTFSTGTRVGYTVTSGIANTGALFATLGKAWIRSDIW